MTTKFSEAVKAEILKADILTNHPAPPTPSVYFDSIMVWKNPTTGQTEAVFQREGKDVATLRTHHVVNFADPDCLVLKGICGYIPISLSAA